MGQGEWSPQSSLTRWQMVSRRPPRGRPALSSLLITLAGVVRVMSITEAGAINSYPPPQVLDLPVEIPYLAFEAPYRMEHIPEIHAIPRDGKAPIRGVERLALLIVDKMKLPLINLLPVPPVG